MMFSAKPPVLLSILFPVIYAATTVGPFAPISVNKIPAYSSAKPCAAKCMVYQGVWTCGYNSGYHDLGADLGCGCTPNNACWCSAGLQSSATSYISSCVSAGCGSFGDVNGDIKSMLDMYGGYCATAHVETSTSKPAGSIAVTTNPPAMATGAVTSRGTGTSGATAASGVAAATPSSPAADKGDKEDEGLSKSDIIALATGLGVGIPSLLIAVIALCIQVRKRKRADSTVIKIESDASQTQLAHMPTPPPVYAVGTTPNMGHGQYHELPARGGQRFY